MKIRFWRRIPALPKATLLFFLILGGCEKDKSFEGKSSVLLEGTHLKLGLTVMLREEARFHFYVTYVNEEGRTRFESVIYNVPAKIGDYTVNKENIPGSPYSPYLFTMDADLGLDDYLLLEGGNNTISLTEINSAEQIVRGTFQLTFVRDTLLSAIKKDIFPDTIRLTDGTFETPYEKK